MTVANGSLHALLRRMLHLKESPEQTALAFAIGVFIAFCPLYGLHMVLAVLCAWWFGLNFIAILAGAFVNNPWTVVPILGATYWTGALLLGRRDVPAFNWHDLSLSTLYQQILPYAIPFALGGLVLSVVGGLLSYPAAYWFVSKYRRRGHVRPLPPSEPLS